MINGGKGKRSVHGLLDAVRAQCIEQHVLLGAGFEGWSDVFECLDEGNNGEARHRSVEPLNGDRLAWVGNHGNRQSTLSKGFETLVDIARNDRE